jgi:DNA-binding HxlR family transcriptional regulator
VRKAGKLVKNSSIVWKLISLQNMSLPINIKDLIHGHSVEWERLEFKCGWNPEEVIRTMCAFANDLNNWGGGYIIIGIEANDGMPVLPPAGLQQSQLDKIQNKVVELGNRIQPAYLPIMQPYTLGVYFMVTLPINSLYFEYASDIVSEKYNKLIINSLRDLIELSNQVSDIAGDIVSDKAEAILNEHVHNKVERILNSLNEWGKIDDLFANIQISKHPRNRKKYLDPLLKIGWVKMEFPDKRTSPNQRYRITETGKKLVSLIRK